MLVEYMGRGYITLQGCDDKEKALKVIKEMASWLEKMTNDEVISSYLARPLYDEETILDGLLEPEEILLFTNNRLPVVYCTVAIEKPSTESKQSRITEFEEAFGLKMFRAWTGEAISKKNKDK